MARFKERISGFWGRILPTLRAFPLEALLGTVFYICRLTAERTGMGFYLWFFPLFVTVFFLGRLAQQKPVFRLLQIVAWLGWIPLLLWQRHSPDPVTSYLIVAYIIAVLFLLLGDRKLPDRGFAENAHLP